MGSLPQLQTHYQNQKKRRKRPDRKKRRQGKKRPVMQSEGEGSPTQKTNKTPNRKIRRRPRKTCGSDQEPTETQRGPITLNLRTQESATSKISRKIV